MSNLVDMAKDIDIRIDVDDYVTCNHVIDGAIADDGVGIVQESFRTVGNQIAIKWHGQEHGHVYNASQDGTFYIKNASIVGSIRHVIAIESSSIDGDIYVQPKASLRVFGKNKIKGSVFFDTSDIVITGAADGVLEIDGSNFPDVGYRDMQPLLGARTWTGLSYDRWERAHLIKTITVENVKVSIIPKNVHFTIGTYGYEKVPEVFLDNGELLCPEMTGKRLLIRNVGAPVGSTKISGKCTYFISHTEDGSDIPWSYELKTLKDEIAKINPEVASKITVLTYDRNAEAILELMKLSKDIDISLLLQDKYISNMAMAKCCCILGIPTELFTPRNEMQWMLNKVKYFMMQNGFTEEQVDNMEDLYERYHLRVKKLYPYRISQMTPLQIRTVYEMIPEFEFSFSGKSMEECVAEYLSTY